MIGSKVKLPELSTTEHGVIMAALNFYIDNEKSVMEDRATNIKMRNEARQNHAQASLVREKIK